MIHYDTDKFELGYIEHVYSDVVKHLGGNVRNVLEIGIYRGGSLLMWRDFFHGANIVGVDINYCPHIAGEDNITQCIANAYSRNFISHLSSNHFDLIVDDGPHTLESMCFFLTHYPKKLKAGGMMVLEDITDKTNLKILESVIDYSLDYKIYDMTGKQTSPQLRERWKDGLFVICVWKP